MPVSDPKTAVYTLYGTSACHLCEVAQALLGLLAEARPEFEFTEVDISTSEALLVRYGVRIPVLRDPTGRELDWPFSAEQLWVFCEEG